MARPSDRKKKKKSISSHEATNLETTSSRRDLSLFLSFSLSPSRFHSVQGRRWSTQFCYCPTSSHIHALHCAGSHQNVVMFCRLRALWRFEGGHLDVILGPFATRRIPLEDLPANGEIGSGKYPYRFALAASSEAKSRVFYGPLC